MVTALYVASQNGHVEVVNILLQNGAHVDVKKEVSLPSTVQALRLKGQYKYMAYQAWPKLSSSASMMVMN